LAGPWLCPPISDRTNSPIQALYVAQKQSRGHHLGALAAAQAGQHDPEVGEVAARPEPEETDELAGSTHKGGK
jgi:hypothetical protein